MSSVFECAWLYQCIRRYSIYPHAHACKCVLFPSQQFDQIHSGAVALSHLHSDGDLVCRPSPAVTGAVMQGDMARCPVHLYIHLRENCSILQTSLYACQTARFLSTSLSLPLCDQVFFSFTNNLIVLSQSCECGNNLQHGEIQKWDYILSSMPIYSVFTQSCTSRGIISKVLKQDCGDQQTNKQGYH